MENGDGDEEGGDGTPKDGESEMLHPDWLGLGAVRASSCLLWAQEGEVG